jgi:hypothetical protein
MAEQGYKHSRLQQWQLLISNQKEMAMKIAREPSYQYCTILLLWIIFVCSGVDGLAALVFSVGP